MFRTKKKRLFSLLTDTGAGSNTFRMTAMIDVIFLLLIFFLLTAKFRPAEDFLPVNIPAERVASPLAVEALAIKVDQIDSGCSISISDQKINFSDTLDRSKFREMVESVLNSNNRYLSDPIEIVCGEDVSWQNLVIVYDTLYGAGLTDISFQIAD